MSLLPIATTLLKAPLGIIIIIIIIIVIVIASIILVSTASSITHV
jgi:hypothetical protein